MKQRISILFWFLCFLTASITSKALTIKTTYGNLATCDTMTRGIYIFWWDKSKNIGASVSKMADSMISYRNYCLNTYGMQDPPNPKQGYYYNIYVYYKNDAFSAYSSGWGQGQGTDANNLPFLTFPGIPNDITLAHETFHVFQYSANSSGFGYSGDSQWFIEASANWFAAVYNPASITKFVESESLVKLPHVALWLSYQNMPSYYPNTWQRYVHQYALSVFLYYLTQSAGVSGYTFANGFYANATQSPQQYLYNKLGGDNFRKHFVDWAAHMTNNFDFIDGPTVARSELEFKNVAEAWDDKEFVFTMNDTATGQWYRPADSVITAAWAFNVYKLYNTSNTPYTFDIRGDLKGSKGSLADFRGKVLIQNNDSGARFIDVTNFDSTNASVVVNLVPGDTVAYFIVASTPNVFTDVEQLYRYDVRITKGIAPPFYNDINDINVTQKPRSEIARYDILGRVVDKDHRGITIIRYSDGTAEKQMIIQ